MKIWTSILVAGAILAFAAPSAFTAVRAIPADEYGGTVHVVKGSGSQHLVRGGALGGLQAQLKTLRKQNAALAAKNKALTAANASLLSSNSAQAGQISALNQRIWDLTGPRPLPLPDLDADCADYGLCTAQAAREASADGTANG